MLRCLTSSLETCLLLQSPFQLLHRQLLNLISMLLTLSSSVMHWCDEALDKHASMYQSKFASNLVTP